ncbi:MAG: sulfite exporter TauE/SafE family protein [Chloroflexi bacterium]|nr:sulfite exporter TauE/SafE family protein [Chloroflexota bacterium]
MEQISLLVAFGAGLASFLSPCVVPLVPTYFGSLCGPQVLEAEGQRNRLPVFLHSLSFVAGFTLVFVLLGVGAGFFGAIIGSYLVLSRKIAGILLLVFGVLMLAALKVRWLNFEKRFAPSLGNTTGYSRSFLIGAIFPVAWIPCTSWQLGSILTLAGASETASQGGFLLAVYSLGLGLPFLIIGAAFASLAPLLRRIQRYSRVIYIIGAAMLITVGILILTDRLNLFATGFTG